MFDEQKDPNTGEVEDSYGYRPFAIEGIELDKFIPVALCGAYWYDKEGGFISHPIQHHEKDGCPMADGAKENEYVPHGMEVLLRVLGIEICARSVKQSFGKDEQYGGCRKIIVNGFGNEHTAPPHDKIQGERQAWVFSQSKNLIYGAANDYCPEYAKDGPTQPTSHHGNADGSVGAGYHDIYAYVVALAQYATCLTLRQPMVDGGREKHEEHADNEEQHAHGPLPSNGNCRPHHPDA